VQQQQQRQTLLQQLSQWIGHVVDVEWTLDGERVGFCEKILDVRLVDGLQTVLQIDTDQGQRYHIVDGPLSAVAISPPTLAGGVLAQGSLLPPADDAPAKCPGCGSSGFAPSILGSGRCEFCDGTAGGNPPTAQDAVAPEAQAPFPIWFVTEIPDNFTPDDPAADPWANEPIFQFISGTAGTGKTYNQRARAEVDPRVKLTATTGIAAINLGGQTINSLLYYGNTPELQTKYELGYLNAALRRLADSNFTRIVIDEASMMDGHQLDILCEALDRTNEYRESVGETPLGITLVGDFCQLPPVKAPFVFERPSFQRFRETTVKLTQPRRQADPAFVGALQAVRRGDKPAAAAYFERMIKSTIDGAFLGTTVMAKNDEVDRHNSLRMLELPGPEVTYTTVREGKQASEWKKIPDVLRLKQGALVMILANKRERQEGVPPQDWPLIYANGDLAIVQDLTRGVPWVKLLRNGLETAVSQTERELKSATGAKGEKKERESREGYIRYMPLRPAWATTVHKSQGLSFDQVQVVFNDRFWAHPAMLYVALSRARTPEGLRLVGSGVKQFTSRITVDPKVIPWL
jgi:hypothetical protein